MKQEWYTSNSGITHLGTKPSVGPISEGTLDLDQLLLIFSIQLRVLSTSHATFGARAGAERARHSGNVTAKQEALDYLVELLNAYAPVGVVFGAHPDDAACFGFWPAEMA